MKKELYEILDIVLLAKEHAATEEKKHVDRENETISSVNLHLERAERRIRKLIEVAKKNNQV